MQHVKFGNILSVKSGFIVHGCNARGVMGGGVAASIRSKYPQAYEDYRQEFERSGLKLGTCVITDIDAAQGLYVANAITQENFGNDGRKYVSYEAIHKAMSIVAEEANDRGLSVHYPLIGAGLAGGNWGVIQPVIDDAFSKYDQVERTLWIFD